MGRRRITKASKLEDILDVRFRLLSGEEIVKLIFDKFDLDNIFVRCPHYNNTFHASVCVYRRFVSKPKRMCNKCDKILDILLSIGDVNEM